MDTPKGIQNYSSDAVRVLEAMSMTDGKGLIVVGSMSLRSSQYAGDFDGYEIVRLNESSDAKALDALATKFKERVRALRSLKDVFVADIKAGELNGEPQRWTVADVLAGSKKGYTLQQAFSSNGITKLDAIGWINGNHFAEFSVIYEAYNKGRLLNTAPEDVRESLMEDLKEYEAEGNPFKALKRRFSLAKLDDDRATMEKLLPILNGDLGRLYSLTSDIGTLLYMLENYDRLPIEDIRFEIDQFRDRFARIWTLKDFVHIEPALLAKVTAALKKPNTGPGRASLARTLEGMRDVISGILAKHTPKDLLRQ
jgi:hypothetical protein